MNKYLWVLPVVLLLLLNTEISLANKSMLEQGKMLRGKAEKGDSDAMLKLALLLQKHAPSPKRPMKMCDGKLVNPLIKQDLEGKDCKIYRDEKSELEMKKWKGIGTKWQVYSWINKSAENGNATARKILCDMSRDNMAPARSRENGKKWCD